MLEFGSSAPSAARRQFKAIFIGILSKKMSKLKIVNAIA